MSAKSASYGLMTRFAIPLIVISPLIFSACNFRIEKTHDLDRVALTASFRSVRQNIFVPKCVECHSGSNAPHGIDLSSYQRIVNSSLFPPLVIPGNPESSSLYSACASGDMPKNASRLSSAELKVIYDWIKNGASESEDSPTPHPSVSPSPAPTGEPPDDKKKKEPCDVMKIGNEPGFIQCSNEPGDDD